MARILLVENDPSLREVCRSALMEGGHAVLCAPDGFNALLEADGRIDLLITDILLPHMSGIELWRKLSSCHPEAHVLFTTASLEHARILFGRGKDRPGILPRPFATDALVKAVEAALASSPFLREDRSSAA
jgi:two-component system cell cycle sensor histidine kinase/response regulator CckA